MGCDGRWSGLLRRHLQPTLTYWSVFFSFGLCIAFLGPTLLDLRCQTHSSLAQISWVFFSQQLCLLLGSVLGGVFKRTLAQSLWALFASSLTISLVFAVIPLCRDVKVLASVMALAGLAMGCIDTVANMQLVRIYQKDSALFLQVLHFFVGFGALLSPLIADPFLSENGCLPANSTVNITAGSHLFHASRVLGPHHAGARPGANQTLPGPPPPGGAGTRVSYAFWIMALINLPVPLAVLYLLSKERLLTCCPQRRPLLLSADELALETQPPEKEAAASLPPKVQSHPAHEDLLSCCQGRNLRGAPYSFFAIHVTAALVLFVTDGMTVSLPSGPGGRVFHLRVQLRRGGAAVRGAQGGWLPAQPLLGLPHPGPARLHPRLLPREAGHHGLRQPGRRGGDAPGAARVLLQRRLPVRGHGLPGPVPQQHLPQHAGLHGGHPAVPRLCDHSAGDRGGAGRDVPPDAGWLGVPGAGQPQLPGLRRDLCLPGFRLLHLAAVFPQDAPWTLISSSPGQTARAGERRVLPEIEVGEGGRRRPPAS